MTNPAVVKAATVADPNEMRKIAAIIHASKIGDKVVPWKSSAT